MRYDRLAAVLAACGLLAACAGFGASGLPFGRLAAGPNASIETDGLSALSAGDRFLSEGKPDLALTAYTRAALGDAGPTIEVRTAMANANLGLGRLNQAEQLLRGAAIEAPRNAAVRNNLGVVLMGRGRIGEAYRMFRIASALSPSPNIRHNLALAETRFWAVDYGRVEEGTHVLLRRQDGVYSLRTASRVR